MQTIQEIRSVIGIKTIKGMAKSSKDQAVIDFMMSVTKDPKLAKELVLNSKFIELVIQYREYFI